MKLEVLTGTTTTTTTAKHIVHEQSNISVRRVP